jgi:hypothetical protein
MGTPTINVGQSSGDTSLFTIMNLVRALVNDSQQGATATPGEGQIFTDNPAISPFTQPFLNSAIRELYRELRNVGQPTLIKDNILIENLPVINSPRYGLGQPDPAVQTYLGFGGFFDGTQIHSQFLLPGDVITVERVWERQTGTTNRFVPMVQSQFGLPSVMQGNTLGMWEWRNDNINMLGSLQNRDLRLRYWCALPQFFSQTLDFESTFVPIIDCTDAVAYKTAVKYATMLASPLLKDLKEDAKEQMFQLKQEHVRRSQSIEYTRIPFGNVNGSGYFGNTNFGWQ